MKRKITITLAAMFTLSTPLLALPTDANASDTTSTAIPSPCEGEHSSREPPASTKCDSISKASGASVSRPHVRVPSPIDDR